MLPDPTLLVGLAGAVIAYTTSLRRADPTRPPRGAVFRFGAAIGVLAIVLGPAMEHAADRSLAAHMIQHQVLVLVAAPLLATSGALILARGVTGRALTAPWSGPSGRAMAAVALSALHLGVMLVWHVPAAYTAALASPQLHHMEHVTMLGTAVLAWAAVLAAAADERAVFGAVLGLALLAIGGAVLGVVLLMSPTELYSWYGGGAALEEQRVAGALMKVGALVGYAGVAIGFTARWFQQLAATDEGVTVERGRGA